jgi:hypothetical protein
MIRDYYTGATISETVPDYLANSLNQPGYAVSWDSNPNDTLLDNFYYDGTDYLYYQTDSAAINFPTNSLFNYDQLFPPLEDFINDPQVQAGGTLGTRNNNFNQANGIIQGALNGFQPSAGLINADLVNNGDLQDLPPGGFGATRFE